MTQKKNHLLIKEWIWKSTIVVKALASLFLYLVEKIAQKSLINCRKGD